VGNNFYCKTINPQASELQSQNSSAVHTFTAEFDTEFPDIYKSQYYERQYDV